MIVGVTTHVCYLKKQLLPVPELLSQRAFPSILMQAFIPEMYTHIQDDSYLAGPEEFPSSQVAVMYTMYFWRLLWSVNEQQQFDPIIGLDVVYTCGYVCIMHRSQCVKMIFCVCVCKCVWENFLVCALMRRPPLCVASSGSSLQPAWEWPSEMCLFGQR